MSDSQEHNTELSEEEQAVFEAELQEAYADIEARHAVDTQKGFENVVVVDNIPIVDESKRQRLIERLCQMFDKAGAGIDQDRIAMPWDDAAGTNKGFLFLTYPDVKAAENALIVLEGTPFGKAHTLYVNRFGDIEKYASLPIGEGELPSGWKEKPYVERDHLRSWLGDRLGRDQFLTFADATATLNWNGRNGNVEVARGTRNQPLKNPKWGELYLSWSPLGTYLASTHRAGVALWCGPDLDGENGVNLFRLTHPNVRLLQFSPCENYIVTWSDVPCTNIENHDVGPVRSTFNAVDDEGFQYVVWDIKSQKPLRTFPADKSDQEGTISWPVMKWSPDDKYIAKCNIGVGISVYELPHMGMLDRKSVKIDGVQDFEWCPMSEGDFEDRRKGKGKECTIVYWSPEAPNQPARVQLMALPSRTVLRSKNLFNVTECKLYWQNQGDYLCVKVDRHSRKARTKKATFCNLELFRMRQKDIPVEVIEHKDYIPTFSWEPSGARFAIVSSNDPNYGQALPGVVVKYNVDFYAIDAKRGDFAVVKHIEGKDANTISWSPKGRHLVLGTLNSTSKCELEFWDLDFVTDDNPRKEGAEPAQYVQLMGTGEHYGVSDLSWDPSGRYLASSGSAWKQSPEPGYMIWDFKGQQLAHTSMEKFKQFLWRPRPPTLLTKELQRKVRRELKEHSRTFDEQDQAEENRGTAEKRAQREREVGEWNAWRKRNIEKLLRERKARGKELVQEESGPAEETVEEWIEDLVQETEEYVEL